MSETKSPVEGSTPSLCQWCDTPLETVISRNHSVCLRCYTCLYEAGLNDEEIFNPKFLQDYKKKNVKRSGPTI
jgi:hypothetical protein